eukprot:2354026-Amphidinium_carterae.2
MWFPDDMKRPLIDSQGSKFAMWDSGASHFCYHDSCSLAMPRIPKKHQSAWQVERKAQSTGEVKFTPIIVTWSLYLQAK